MTPHPDRISHARTALRAYIAGEVDGFTDQPLESNIADLITDLLHLAKLRKMSIAETLTHAEDNFRLESMG